MNALIAASLFDKPEVVAHLLAAGAKVNVMSYRYQSTALMLAAKEGYIDVVKALLTCENVVVDSSIADGPSALVLAAFGNHPDVVKRLMAAGAAVNFASGLLHQTALANAAYWGYVDVVKTLLESPQVALDATNVLGQSALHIAANCGKPEVVKCLLEAGASRMICDGDGYMPLGLAINQKHAAVVEVLLQHGATLQDFHFIDPNAEPSGAVTVRADAAEGTGRSDLARGEEDMAGKDMDGKEGVR